MLLFMNIKNVALIEQIDIEWEPRMTVLTGETGAGKSIIIDCVNLLLGARSDKTLIRYGADKARIQGMFSVSDEIAEMLKTEGIDTEEGSVLIDRELSQEGRNICRINGVVTTQNILREVGAHLINIHGQQDNQALLTPERHIVFLDEYARTDMGSYLDVYKKRKEIIAKLEAMDKSERERVERIDLLNYQVDEISVADIRVGEKAELEAKKAIMDNSEKLAVALSDAYNSLYSDNCAYDLIGNATAALERISGIDGDIDEIASRITDAKYTLEDAVHEIRNYLDNVEFDENEQNAVEERLDTISRLEKKYGGDEESVLKYLDEALSELDSLKNHEQKIEELSKLLAEADKRISAEAAKLTETRKKAAKILQKEVEAALSDLDMPKVRFEVSFKNIDFSEKGAETAEFMICPNAGEEMKPLVKIASGGELSRIMLAIKSIVCDDVDTLIFDEIDTGVSGNAAKKIAARLAALAEKKQVICVSHSPQIAAAANNHFAVSKGMSGERTVTAVKKLSDEERIYEIAHIIDGSDLTETAIMHAREMMGL